MGLPQAAFIKEFKAAFETRFAASFIWSGGQRQSNVAALAPHPKVRRDGCVKLGECFELGDLRSELTSHTLVVEFESGAIAVHNLVKYWPYILGELEKAPTRPIVLAHFSNWNSYGSHRNLWEWVQTRMVGKTPFIARQFDHWGSDAAARSREFESCFGWIEGVIGSVAPLHASAMRGVANAVDAAADMDVKGERTE